MGARLRKILRGIDALNDRIGRIVLWGTLLMVLVGAYNALARYAESFTGLHLSSNTYLELQWYIFSAVFLLGGAYTLRHHGHVRVDVIYDRLGPIARAWINLAGHILFLIPFCAFMLWISYAPVTDSWMRGEGSPDAGGLPRYLVKSLVPIAFILLLLQAFSEIYREIEALRSGRGEPEEEEETGHV